MADLEAVLVSVPETDVETAVTRFYAEHRIESPGILPADFARVVGPA